MPSESFDIAVIGAGPAGLAAATSAASAGLRVTLVDAAGQPGGQFWRHRPEDTTDAEDDIHQHDWQTYQRLRVTLDVQIRAQQVHYLPGHQVWSIERDRTQPTYLLQLSPSHAGVAVRDRVVPASAVILATGAYDRQLPVPGWTLPGVLSAGAAQSLLKGSGTVAGQRAVVAGTGPFLLPVAAALAAAGASVEVCEANAPTRWLRQLSSAIRLPGKGIEALSYGARFARHRIRYRTRSAVTRIEGTDSVTGVGIARLDRRGRPGAETIALDADVVALGWGFTPSLELAMMLGAQTRRDADGSLVAVVDDAQRSTIRGTYIAGEGTGVGGAQLAVAEGELAGLVAASDLGKVVSEQYAGKLRTRIRRLRAFAYAMHHAHPIPAGWTDWLTDETTVCRCEEVTVAAVDGARTDLAAADPRTVKSLVRPGMGWCQGRICGFGSAELLAARESRLTTAAELRPLATRPCAVPLTLAELAADTADDRTDTEE